MATSTVNVQITGDASGLKKATGDAEASLGKLGGKAEGFGSSLVKGFAVGAGGAAIASFAKDGIKLASDLSEASSKNAKIFKGNADEIAAAGKTAAETMGMSKAAYAEAAGSLGLLGQSAGLTGTALSDFATTAAQRAADIGSFNNAANSDVIEAWGSAMRGEMEPMRRFGVLLDDATLRQKALQMGLIKTTKDALNPQTKALAANALIMEQTAGQAGDFADTSDGLANQSKILTARIDNLKIALGEGLTPALLAAGEALSGAAEDADGFFKGIGGNEGFVKSMTNALGNLAHGMDPVQAGMRGVGKQASETSEAAAAATKKLATETAYAGSEAERYVNTLIGKHDATVADTKAMETAAEAEKALKEQTKNLEQADKDAADAAKEHASAMDKLFDASTSLYLSEIDLQEATEHFNDTLIEAQDKANAATEARKRYKEGSDEIYQADTDAADALRSLQREMVGVGEKAVKTAQDKKTAAGGGELSLLEKYSAQKQALIDLTTQYPAAKGAIDQYIKTALDPLIAKSGEVRDAIVDDANAAITAWRNADGSITITADNAERRAGASAPPSAPASGGGVRRSGLGTSPFDNAYGNSAGMTVIVNQTINTLKADAMLGQHVIEAVAAAERNFGAGWRK